MFLEFLVDKGHLNKEQLLIVVMEQMESMPSLVRLLLEENKVPSDQLYGLLIEGAKSNRSLFEMLKLKDVLSDSDIQTFLNLQNFKSKSIGEIIISHKIMEREKYEQALRDYAGVKDSYEGQSPAVEVNASPVVEATPDPVQEAPTPVSAPAGISAAALESLMAVQDVDPDMLAQLEGQMVEDTQAPSHEEKEEEIVEEASATESPTLGEYLNFYDDSLQSELFVTANRYRLKGKKRDIAALHEQLVKILSLAKLNEFSFQIKLLEPYEHYMGHLLNNDEEAPEEWRSCPSEMLELLWEFRKAIVEGQNEGQVLAQSKFKEMYLNNLKSVMSHLKRSA